MFLATSDVEMILVRPKISRPKASHAADVKVVAVPEPDARVHQIRVGTPVPRFSAKSGISRHGPVITTTFIPPAPGIVRPRIPHSGVC